MRCSWIAVLLVISCGEEPEGNPYAIPASVPPPVVRQCYAEPVPGLACTSEAPAPHTGEEIAAYLTDAALPLTCDPDVTDLRVVDALFANQTVFMLGEVHGSNEIGVLSARIFDRLVRENGVRALAFEMPMDFREYFQDWVDTGNNMVAQQLLGYFAENMFANTLLRQARELVEDGYPIVVGPVDAPYGTEVAIDAIEASCQGLVDHRELVLDSLPAPINPFGSPSQSEIDDTRAYVDAVLEEIDAICTELDADECDVLTNMSLAMWTAVEMFDPRSSEEQWFAVREEVIYHNLRHMVPDEQTTLYLHMGAFHTNKLSESAGSRMAREFERTAGEVVSVASAWGEGSEIWYSEVVSLPSSPPVIANALAEAIDDPHFVSTTLPDASCVKNPLADMTDDTFMAPMGELYDGYFHIRRLTPEVRPDDTTLKAANNLPAARVWQRWQRVHERERVALHR